MYNLYSAPPPCLLTNPLVVKLSNILATDNGAILAASA
jgi:hypothetical protein